ncbi:MAG: carboxypeptidase regulatory-like domain-containing protein [Niabella sp.]
MLKKIFFFMTVALLATVLTNAQVTTGSIVGTVKSQNGENLQGATIVAVHVPTGSKYSSSANSTGQYTLPNLRVGGPYTLTVSYTGFKDEVFDDLQVTLGNPQVVDVVLKTTDKSLDEVVVTGVAKGSILSSQRNGTSVTLNLRDIQNTPTVNRSVQDYVRLMPQVKVGNASGDGASTGMSFGGQNNRYNQFSIDGANATDGFGLGSTGTNGGQANVNPISMEAIQELQIVMSPYDVTQGGFTGGGINAVTKSGSNQFHVSLYGQFQNQDFVGKNAGYNSDIVRKKLDDFKNTTYGASFSGALVKDKLFFYINAEQYKRTTPLLYDPTVSGSGSSVSATTLESLRQYLIDTYDYDPGSYGTINKENQSTSLFARLDWNINDKNKLAFRFNHVDGYNDVISRTATSAIYSKSGYRFNDKNNSFVLELNSNFSAGASNTLRLTYTSIRDNRLAMSDFPSLTIYDYNTDADAAITYNIGGEYSSIVNALNQDVFTITDNLNLYKGKHTFTFGTDNQFYNSKNWFLQNFYGSYYYGTYGASGGISDFEDNTNLQKYYVGYSNSSDANDKAPASLHAAQFGIYGQDVVNLTDRFKLTYGVRIDMPVFFNKPDANDDFNEAFASYGVATNQMPKTTPLFSPRAGFNWDINGDRQTQLRGGAGLFTGRIPFVWISNQISNTGVASSSASYTSASAVSAAGITFNYDPSDAHRGAYIPTSTSSSAPVINVIDKNFKFPQVFRANLALDKNLNFWGLIGTIEAIYTKTLHNADYYNLNLAEGGNSTVQLSGSTRPYYSAYNNTSYGNVLLLRNTSKGYSYSFTGQLQKQYSRGWRGSVAYTLGHGKSLNDLTSSVAQSNWRSPLNINGLNAPDLATSNFDMGSRIIGQISKEIKYANNHLSTTFNLIYTGQSGQVFSYVYGGSALGSLDYSNTTLVYIPSTFEESNFVDISGGATASEQWENFQSFLNDNPSLKDYVGKNTKRNAFRLPWENHFDFRIAQNFMFKQHKIELFYSILNVGNLLNKDWGWSYGAGDGFYTLSKSLFSVVSSGTQTADGVSTTVSASKPGFTFSQGSMTEINGKYRPYSVSDFTSRWSSMIGLRYSF